MQAAGETSKTATVAGGRLGLWDTVSVIVGVVIGAGIYETAPLVLANVADARSAILVWLAGGVLSLIGAACYAELASAYPRSGGDYVYLTRAFGEKVGFLFGWAQLTVIMTGSIGMMAYVFADYAGAIVDGRGRATTWLAIAAVVALTAINAVSVSAGRYTQNVLTALKVLGIGLIVVVGFTLGGEHVTRQAMPAPEPGSLGLAMIFVLYTFGGWNDAAFVAAEVRDPGRNMPRALFLGMAAITTVYVLVNAAFIWGLGFEGARSSNAVAAELLRSAVGPLGAKAMALIVMISALGAVSAPIFTGSRLHATVGADHRVFAALGRWHPRLGAPLWSLAVQLAITIGLMALVGTRAGRAGVEHVVRALGLSAPQWSGHGGFDTLLRATAPVFWVFFLMTGLSLFMLRVRDKDSPRPFRVPGYPIVPLVFCATCAFMIHSAVAYAGALTLLGVAPMVIGLPIYWLSKRRPRERNDSWFKRLESGASSS